MKFSISYLGPEWLFHLRRDFILAVKYSLEDLGHDVALQGMTVDPSRFNLIIGAYFLPPEALRKVDEMGLSYAHINTEVISGDMLNFNPKKTDFMGSYLPSLKRASFVWDVILDNLAEHRRYGTNAHFLRWGWHPRMRDIDHRPKKDLDYYFFGMLSERRKRLLKSLRDAGLVGENDHSCPYFLRNDRIARARVQLNLIQEDIYTHVNSFRICYLANNACCILSENEQDPANYLQYAEIIDPANLVDAVRQYSRSNAWKERGDKAQADFMQHSMVTEMEQLLDLSFQGAGKPT